MLNFSPAISKDNFFDDPHQIIKTTKNISFKKSNYISGCRSEDILNINKNLFEYINKKVVENYFAGSKKFTFEAESYFQKSDPDINDGWVHQDHSDLTAVIYLTYGGTSGTSIYDLKEEYLFPDWSVGGDKHRYFGNKENYSDEEKNKIQEEKLKNNSFFNKTINFEGKFNRMICFDSRQFHASDICDKERLVIISFIYNVKNV